MGNDVPIGRYDPREFIEIQLGDRKKKIFVLVYPFEEEIWIDLKGLPNSAFLCACCDGITMMQAKVGKRDEKRLFLPINWVINDWGGDKELVEAIKKRKTICTDSMNKYREQLKK